MSRSRTILSFVLALSMVLWADGAVAVISATSHAAQCHARVPHMQHAANSMPCCPSHAASLPASFIAPPPCCDLSNQPARPLAFVVTAGKSRSSQLSASGTAGAMFASSQRASEAFPVTDSPPFVKPVFDLKTDLRI